MFFVQHVVVSSSALLLLLSLATTCDAFLPSCRLAGPAPFAAASQSIKRQLPASRACACSSGGALRMAGFGGKGAKKPKETPKSLTSGESVARTAQKEYNKLKKDGGTIAQVFAKQKGSDQWFPVGYVCTEAGKTAEGVQGQKRLILEHAAEMYDELRSMSGVRVVMDAGYAVEEGGEVAVCKAKYSGEKVGVALDPLPTGPFFRSVGAAGGFARDMSSAATLGEKAKNK